MIKIKMDKRLALLVLMGSVWTATHAASTFSSGFALTQAIELRTGNPELDAGRASVGQWLSDGYYYLGVEAPFSQQGFGSGRDFLSNPVKVTVDHGDVFESAQIGSDFLKATASASSTGPTFAQATFIRSFELDPYATLTISGIFSGDLAGLAPAPFESESHGMSGNHFFGDWSRYGGVQAGFRMQEGSPHSYSFKYDENHLLSLKVSNFSREPIRGEFEAVVLANIPAVPEPESYAMLAIGLALVGAVARRRVTATGQG